MPTQAYRLHGARVPSVTTIIGNLGWNKSPLMIWAFRTGQDNPDLHTPYDVSRVAAEIGTLAHAMAEAEIKGTIYEPPPNVPTESLLKAETAIGAYHRWCDQTHFRPIESEIALVSEVYSFGGTIDCIAALEGGLGLIDFKSSNGTYADHLIQVAAYSRLWNEVQPHKTLTKDVHLLRWGKDHGDFHHHYYPYDSLEPAWEVFLALRKIHQARRAIERMT